MYFWWEIPEPVIWVLWVNNGDSYKNLTSVFTFSMKNIPLQV